MEGITVREMKRHVARSRFQEHLGGDCIARHMCEAGSLCGHANARSPFAARHGHPTPRSHTTVVAWESGYFPERPLQIMLHITYEASMVSPR